MIEGGRPASNCGQHMWWLGNSIIFVCDTLKMNMLKRCNGTAPISSILSRCLQLLVDRMSHTWQPGRSYGECVDIMFRCTARASGGEDCCLSCVESSESLSEFEIVWLCCQRGGRERFSLKLSEDQQWSGQIFHVEGHCQENCQECMSVSGCTERMSQLLCRLAYFRHQWCHFFNWAELQESCHALAHSVGICQMEDVVVYHTWSKLQEF